jgi:hypothetical protein
MKLKFPLLGGILKRFLLLFFMVFCVWVFYFNAKRQAKLYRDYRSTYLSIAEVDTANFIPRNIQYKIRELDGDMNVNASFNTSIFVYSLGLTVIFFLYTVGYGIAGTIRNYKAKKNTP